jgi:hypothetical protein
MHIAAPYVLISAFTASFGMTSSLFGSLPNPRRRAMPNLLNKTPYPQPTIFSKQLSL